jgi:hypothetical protein
MPSSGVSGGVVEGGGVAVVEEVEGGGMVVWRRWRWLKAVL